MDVTKYPDRSKVIKEEFILTHALKEQLWWRKSQDGREVKMVEYEAMVMLCPHSGSGDREFGGSACFLLFTQSESPAHELYHPYLGLSLPMSVDLV